MKKKSVTKVTASKKAVKTPAEGFNAEAVRARAAEKAAKPVAVPVGAEPVAVAVKPKKANVVTMDKPAPEVVELQKLVDAAKPGPVAVAPSKLAIERQRSTDRGHMPVEAAPVATPAVPKVPKDRSDAAKRAWITIRANRAAAAAAKAS